MKTLLLLVFSVLFLTACKYKVPITTDHNIPVDPLVIGSWKIVPEEGQDNDSAILVFKFSDTEYSVRYHEDGGELYFRAYAINIGGVDAVQLELIGSGEGPVTSKDEERYHVVAYQLDNDLLKISSLNTELVDDELADSESLKKAFILNKENPGLFTDPGFFNRVPD